MEVTDRDSIPNQIDEKVSITAIILHGYISFMIYKHPKDYPQYYVVRPWAVLQKHLIPNQICCLCENLEEARAGIPNGGIHVPRLPEDDSSILEAWLYK